MIEMIDQELYLKGKIDAVNADQIFQQGLNVIQRQQNFPLVVNLAGLEQGSTLALAVLVQWLRQTVMFLKVVLVRLFALANGEYYSCCDLFRSTLSRSKPLGLGGGFNRRHDCG